MLFGILVNVVREPKKRLKASESRRALLDAGHELLEKHGIAPGLDRVTLKDAIELSGVPRSTAYRLYEDDVGQLEAFRRDLLRDLDADVDVVKTLDAITAVIEASAAELESKDPVRMATVLRELIRVGIEINSQLIMESIEWRVYMSSLASLTTGENPDTELPELFRTDSFKFGQRFVDFFEATAVMFGLRARAPLTIAGFASLVASATEGVVLRQHIDPSLATLRRPTGPGGVLQQWHAAAVAVEGILMLWAEPDPAAEASADMTSWITN